MSEKITVDDMFFLLMSSQEDIILGIEIAKNNLTEDQKVILRNKLNPVTTSLYNRGTRVWGKKEYGVTHKNIQVKYLSYLMKLIIFIYD